MSLFGIYDFSVSQKYPFLVYKALDHQTTITPAFFDQSSWKLVCQSSSRRGLRSTNFIQFHRVVLELSLKNALNGYISVVYELDKKDVVSGTSKLLDFLGEENWLQWSVLTLVIGIVPLGWLLAKLDNKLILLGTFFSKSLNFYPIWLKFTPWANTAGANLDDDLVGQFWPPW